MSEKNFWKIRSEQYDKLRWVKDDTYLNKIIQFCKPNHSDLVLDVGTGSGKVAKALKPFVNHVIGMDISADMMSYNEWEGMSKICNDILSPIFKNNTFNLITARMVFHHVSDVISGLNNCYNLYNYIYGAMRIQYFSNNSKYNSQYRKKFTELFDIEANDEEYDFLYEKIEKYIKNHNFFKEKEENDINLLKKTNKYSVYKEKLIKNRYINLNLLYKKIFFEYYYNDNLSYQKIKQKYNISVLSIRKYIKYILNNLYTSEFFDIIRNREEYKKK